jgi:hypothetical protein
MRPARAAPGERFACLLLCCGPSGLRNNHCGLLTRWKHSDLRARAVVGKFWTKKLGCQANKLSAHHGNGHFFHPYPKHLTSAWGGGWSGFSSMSVLNIKKCVNLCFSNYSRSESGRQTRRSCPTLFPSHANNSFWHKTHVKGAGSLEGPLVSITS